MMKVLNREPKRAAWRPPRDVLQGVKASIARASGLRGIDLARLDDEEAAELAALVREIRGSAPDGIERSDPGALNDPAKLRRWELLTARAAGQPDDYFVRRRELADITEHARREAEQKAKPARQPRLEAENTIVLPPVIFTTLAKGEMTIVHAIVLCAVIGQVQNGPLRARYAALDGDTLVVPGIEYLLSPFDAEGDIRNVNAAIRELNDAGWIHVKRTGGETRIRLAGPVAAQLKARATQ
jgi:hypothetical protein